MNKCSKTENQLIQKLPGDRVEPHLAAGRQARQNALDALQYQKLVGLITNSAFAHGYLSIEQYRSGLIAAMKESK